MKTPEELVQELELAAEGSLCLYLFVGFEDTSIILSLYQDTEVLPDGRVVSERDPNFRSLLKEAIDHGGVPIGWYRLKTKETACDLLELGPLEDRQKEPWVYEYLTHFFSLEHKMSSKKGTKYHLVYPDGNVLDITNVE